MSKPKKKQRGYSFVEIAVALSITIVLATVSVYISGNVMRSNRLVNQLRVLKSTVLTARAKAIENTAPVLVSIDPDGAILVIIDRNRDGDFYDADSQIVIGGTDTGGLPVGVKKTFENVESFQSGTSNSPTGLPELVHWTGIGTPTEFPNNEFIVMPNGNILDTDNFTPTSGAFFYKTGAEQSAGAVFVSARGEVRTAFASETASSGVWNDWVWHR